MFINWFFLILSIVFLIFLLRKPPLKDWLLVFLIRDGYAGITDAFLVYFNFIEYPIRFLPQIFPITILFDFIVYPTLGVLFAQITDKDKVGMIIIKAFLFNIPIALLEWWFEKNTDLIHFIHWNIWISYFGLVFCSLCVRGVLGIIRYYSKKQELGNA